MDTGFVDNDTMRSIIDGANQNMQNVLRSASVAEENTAKNIATHIYNEVLKFQASLPEPDDVAISYVSFGSTYTILVENMGHIGSNLVSFYGKDSSGKPMEMIQHIYQLSFLLTVAPKPVPEAPKRKIGFVAS